MNSIQQTEEAPASGLLAREFYKKNTGAGRAGAFVILIEGINGIGKSTLAMRLCGWLHKCKYRFEYVHYPTGTSSIARALEDHLTGKTGLTPAVSHLLFCANRYETHTELKELQQTNDFLIVDRYSYSGAAYSAAHLSCPFDLSTCLDMERSLIKADIVVHLKPEDDAQLKVIYDRTNAQRARKIQHDLWFLKRVISNYDEIRRNEMNYYKLWIDVLVGATMTEDLVFEEVSFEMMRFFGSKDQMPINSQNSF